jgi:hypothetical protein
MCRRSLDGGFLNAEPATVSEVRLIRVGPGGQPGQDALPSAAGETLAAWCWTGVPGAYTLYAIGPDGARVRIEGLSGPEFASTPAPGPAPIP